MLCRRYQAAAAANDLPTARKALLDLVRAKEDVPDYWVELGRLQASMGSYSDAYYAFTRAYELDRSNPELLRAVTELALRSGDINLALKRARELEVVSPATHGSRSSTAGLRSAKCNMTKRFFSGISCWPTRHMIRRERR